MKIQNLIEELEEKKEYKEFKTKNPKAFFSAAFLILNLEDKTEEIQLDYFLPEENKIATFAHPFAQELRNSGYTEQCAEPKIHDEILSVPKGKKIPMKKQATKVKLDIDDLKPKCEELIKIYNSNIEPKKIIAILKDNIWNLTLLDGMLGIVRIKINAITEELIDFKKGGLMDFMGIKK